MKPRVAALAVVAVVASSLFGVSAFDRGRSGIVPRVHGHENGDQRGCTNASLSSSYGFYRSGTTPTGPLVSVGTIFWDGNGNFTATQSTSRNGVFIFDVTFSGTYEVAEDCTAKGFLETGVEFVRIVIVDGGKEFYFLSETSGNAVYGVARKIHRPKDGHDGR